MKGRKAKTTNVVSDKAKKIDVNDTKTVEVKKTEAKKTVKKTSMKKPLYIGFGARLIILIAFFILFGVLSVALFVNSFSFDTQKLTTYQETSDLKYYVELYENDFYDEPVLPMNDDAIYVASLIKAISADFKYNFSILDSTNVKFVYSIIAKLKIYDENEKKSYLEKEYVLLPEKELNITNSRGATITENLKIDYSYFNNIATGFKTTYGVTSKSNLYVQFKIKKVSTDGTFQFSSDYVNAENLNIPLSERSVNINIEHAGLGAVDNSPKAVATEKEMKITNAPKLLFSILSIIATVIFTVRIIRLFEKLQPKKNKFDRFVNKILRTYDRLIVESSTIIDFNNYEIIKVNSFEELLDVRDNLKLPINYYVITPHQKAYFYIVSTNIYLYTVKDVDIKK